MLGRVSSERYLRSYSIHIHSWYSLSQTKLANAQKALVKSLLRGEGFLYMRTSKWWNNEDGKKFQRLMNRCGKNLASGDINLHFRTKRKEVNRHFLQREGKQDHRAMDTLSISAQGYLKANWATFSLFQECN